MAGNTLDFTALPAGPFTAPTGYTEVGVAKIFDTGTKFFTLDTGADCFCRDDTLLTGTWIESIVTTGTNNTALVGPSLLTSGNNGFSALTNSSNNNVRIFKINAGVMNTTALWTSTGITLADGNQIRLLRNTSTGEMLVYYRANSGASWTQLLNASSQTYTDNSYSPTYAAVHSRFGYARSMESVYTPAQTVTAINGGNPITVGQTNIVATHTGFGGAITSITTNQTGITCSIVSGDANSTTFNISGWTEAGIYPEVDVVTTFTFNRTGEAAVGNQTVTKPADYVKLTLSGVDTVDPKKFGQFFVRDGHNPEGAALYYDPYDDLVLTADTGGSVSSDGSFTAWFRPASGATSGNMYEYIFTVVDGSIVSAESGLTSRGLSNTGLVSRGLASRGL